MVITTKEQLFDVLVIQVCKVVIVEIYESIKYIFSVLQDIISYLLCLQDRALLSRKCDVAIHTSNSYTSSHQRFLLTGVKVGLEAIEPCISFSTKEMLSSVYGNNFWVSIVSINKQKFKRSILGKIKEAFLGQIGGIGTILLGKIPFNRSTTTYRSIL